MMQSNRLKVANFTTRLPGPLGSQLLSDLGAQVVKWECDEDPDAFDKSELAKSVIEFHGWYKRLNQKTKIKKYKYFNCADQRWVIKNLSSFHALILPVSRNPDMKKMISIWRKIPGIRITLEIGGKRDGGPMQDLLALAQAGILNLSNNPTTKLERKLPELPLAGILLGHQIALEIMSLWARACLGKQTPRRKLYLEGLCQNNLRFLGLNSPKKNRHLYLHQGSTPCYQLYPLKDGKSLALACIERKHYNEVQKLLKMPISSDDRLKVSSANVKKMASFFKKMTSQQVKAKINKSTPGIFIF